MNLPFLVPLREILRTYLIVYLFVDLFGTYSFYSVGKQKVVDPLLILQVTN